MLGIHAMQAPFAAQFGPAAQAGQHAQMMGDVNKAIGDSVDHRRDMEKLAVQERIAAMRARPKPVAPDNSERERLASIIARLDQYGGMPYGGAVS